MAQELNERGLELVDYAWYAGRVAAEPRAGFRRVLLKLSGEALMGTREFGLDAATVDDARARARRRARRAASSSRS